MTIEELKSMIDMEKLKEFNPKLYNQITEDPNKLVEL